MIGGNADELLAMMAPHCIPMEIGSGGKPKWTPQEVAAALGAASQQDRRAVLIYEGIMGPAPQYARLDDELAAIQLGEWIARAERMTHAQIACDKAKAQEPASERAAALRHASMRLEGAKAAMWPRLDGIANGPYTHMRRALVIELRASRVCPVCRGTASVIDGQLRRDCAACLATGRIRISDRQRAAALKINDSTYYRSKWNAVYEWLYRYTIDQIGVGRERFVEALG